MPAGIKIPTTFTAKDNFTDVVSKMTKGVTKFSKTSVSAVQRLDHRINSSFQKLGTYGQLLFGLSLGSVFHTAQQAVRDYETGLVGVSKTTGIVGTDLKKFSKNLIEVSDNLKGVKAVELTTLAQSAGQLGVKGSENILKFSETMAKLSRASDVAGEEGASSIARLLTITREGVGVIDKFSASLVELGNNSAATEAEILEVASEVGRATAAYKLQSQEILGISATLKSLDVRPEAAGTAISKVFRGIELATLKGGEDLKKFAKVMQLTPKQVKESFGESPQKAFTQFIKGLNRISKEGGSVTKTMIDVGLSGEIVSKGIIPLAGNYDLLIEKLKMSSKAFKENSALNKEFEASTQTIDVALKDITKSFENVILKQATAGSGLGKVQKALFFVSKNMETLVVTGASLIGMLIALKAVLLITKVVMFGYNVVLGISTALTQTNKRALIGNTVAVGAYKVAMGIATAAQWLWNAAMTANPLGLIIAGIGALVAVVTLAVKKYDDWGASLLLLMGPLGWIINAVVMFKRNWDGIKEAFTEGGIVAGIKMIGKVLLDSVLYPLEQLLVMIKDLPLIGNTVKSALGKISDLRGGLGLNINSENDKPTLPSTAQASNESVSKSITEKNSNIRLGISSKQNDVEVLENSNDIPIFMGSTIGAF